MNWVSFNFLLFFIFKDEDVNQALKNNHVAENYKEQDINEDGAESEKNEEEEWMDDNESGKCKAVSNNMQAWIKKYPYGWSDGNFKQNTWFARGM